MSVSCFLQSLERLVKCKCQWVFPTMKMRLLFILFSNIEHCQTSLTCLLAPRDNYTRTSHQPSASINSRFLPEEGYHNKRGHSGRAHILPLKDSSTAPVILYKATQQPMHQCIPFVTDRKSNIGNMIYSKQCKKNHNENVQHTKLQAIELAF